MVSRFKSTLRYPNPDQVSDPEVRLFLVELIRALEERDQDIPNLPITRNTYVVSVPSEAYNISVASTLTESNTFLGTLISKMKESGILR